MSIGKKGGKMLVTRVRKLSPDFSRHYERETELKRIEKTDFFQAVLDAEIEKLQNSDDYKQKELPPTKVNSSKGLSK